MSRSQRDLVWIPTFAVLVAFAVPWPLWGVDRVAAGLPVWIWWHVAWLGLCAGLFALFGHDIVANTTSPATSSRCNGVDATQLARRRWTEFSNRRAHPGAEPGAW